MPRHEVSNRLHGLQKVLNKFRMHECFLCMCLYYRVGKFIKTKIEHKLTS